VFGIENVEIAKEENFVVYPENEKAVELFLKCSTQWRCAPMGGFTGLDYNVLFILFDWYKIEPDNRLDLLTDIQVIESGALNELAKAAG